MRAKPTEASMCESGRAACCPRAKSLFLGAVRIATAGVVACLIAGCTVGPKYVRPSMETPPAFRGEKPDTNPASLGDLKWFDVFKDIQLQDYIRTALAQNYDLRDAVARVSAARANLGITRSDQFPTIGNSDDVTALAYSRSGPFIIPPTASRTRNFGGLFLNLLSFEIDIWGQLRSATASARASLLASEANQKAVVTTLVADVATAYFNLLELDEELEIDRRTLASRQDSLRLVKQNQQGGVATLLDVRQAEQLVYSASETVPQTELQIEQGENQICLLLGINPGPVKRGKPLADQQQEPKVPAGIPSSLLERRPDIQAAEQNLIAANANIGVAKAAYFPQLNLTGTLGYESSELRTLFNNRNGNWNIVPQVGQPIFYAGRIKSNVKFTEAQRQIALIQYERSIQTAFREVADALVQYRRIGEIRTQQELLVTTLRDRSRLSYMRYRGGVDTLLNALDADRDLFIAELNLAQTKRNQLLALVQLYKALGGGWQQ